MALDVLDNVGFHPIIKHWFKRQFAEPSPPQQQGWPAIANAEHTLILAPTGSGKTLAAFLWSVDQLLRRSLSQPSDQFSQNPDGIHTLYVSPLKALNNDIHRNLTAPLEEIHQLAESKPATPSLPRIRVAVRTGDTPAHVRQSMLRRPPHILITTPESLYLLLNTERGRELFRELKYVIIDEIHAISNNKRGVHLGLSIERLMPLCRNEPIRIGLSATQKPLDRIAAYLGGQKYDRALNNFIARPVQIIDCGKRKPMDLKVVTPVTTFKELPDSSVWQPVYKLLYESIRAHKTTLVFAGMRAQTEKIARALNQLHRGITGDPSAELALAHHGSISREARYSIEARLKAGNIPAVIATASLELGIDIGSIDLVVQLEAPRSISGALQRIGRSGHLLSATSKGRIVVLYPSDLDDAVAIARSMVQADIEETRIPENALDVLAQQVVAEVAAQSWQYEDLYRLVQGCYCYRGLTSATFRSVVQMLCGKFSDMPLQALKPRLNWDRVNNRLIARRGSRLAAIMNGGTIPDRGYFGVYLENANLKLGEVEEEFAFESRVGQVFFLGNSEWLINQILQDRIIVSPVAAINPRAPFWKGGSLLRDYTTSKKIGRFRRLLIDQLDRGQAASWLMQACSADENTAHNLVDYFARQLNRGHGIATDKQVIVETTIDSGGNPLLMLHAPFGARVNGAWAIAMAAYLEQQYHTQFQYSFDDDGILIRLPETTEPLPLEKLINLSAVQLEAYLIDALPRSPIFLVHFRYNAARSLMLPRSQPGRRVPLWLQRLRASDLLQAVEGENEFPVVLETYRECLQDVFDLTALKKIVEQIETGRIKCKLVNTPIPSPMAAGIIFKFVSVYLYEEDHNRQPREKVTAGREILEEMLQKNRAPAILTPDLIRQAERRWQHLDPYYQAGSAEELFTVIEKLGPIAEDRLARRCKTDPAHWLNKLAAADRITLSEGCRRDKKTKPLWDINRMADGSSGAGAVFDVVNRVRRYLQVRGPLSIDGIGRGLACEQTVLPKVLDRLLAAEQVVRGHLIENRDEEQWCDRHNFTQLYRTAVARRRAVIPPAERSMFHRFLLQWHRVACPGQHWREVIQRYRGYRFPLHFFEREILGSRYAAAGESKGQEHLAEFEDHISNGNIIVHTGRHGKAGRRYVEFRLRGEGNLFDDQRVLGAAADKMGPAAGVVFNFLRENGASYGRDLEAASGLSSAQLRQALIELAEKSLVSCENYRALLAVLQSTPGRTSPRQQGPGSRRTVSRPTGTRSHRSRPRGSSRADLRKVLQQRSRFQDGRWFLTNSPAILGKPLAENERIEAQARLLLQRYGILVKEWYRREHGLIDWYRIFQMLKRLEWQGEIRRGYFVDGLSGVQFALPEALEMLERVCRAPSAADINPAVLSSLDPALPFGAGVDWGRLDQQGNPLKLIRSGSNHLVLVDGEILMVGEQFFQRLTVYQAPPQQTWQLIVNRLHGYLKMPEPIKPSNRLEIHQINNLPATSSSVTNDLLNSGFEKDGTRLVLWPSAV